MSPGYVHALVPLPLERNFAMATKFVRIVSGAAAISLASVGLIAVNASALPPNSVSSGAVTMAPSTGVASTEITLAPPPGAACAGDSATGGYRWQTFVASASVDVGTLTYNGSGPVPVVGAVVAPLLSFIGNSPVVNETTSVGTALLTGIPTVSFSAYPALFFPNGTYKIGFACTIGGATTSYWASPLTITNPAGLAYSFGAIPTAPVLNAPLTPGDGSLAGTFTAADSTPAATGYTVTAVPTSGTVVNLAVAAGSTTFKLTGLVNGTQYSVTVKTTNSFGDSPASNAVTGTPNPPRPPAFQAVSPARLLETRSGPGLTTIDGQFSGMGVRPADSVTELQVGGRAGVPLDASAVVLNVTVTNPTGAGFVTVFPCGSARPTASSLDYLAGATVPNAVISKLGTGGKVCLYTLAATDLIVDLNAFFPNGSTYSSLNPARLLETRSNLLTIDGQDNGIGARTADSVTELQITGRAGVPGNAAAAVLNVTVTEAQGAGFVTVFPCGSSRPNASSLDYLTGSTVANAVISKIGDGGKVCLYTLAGTHLVVDINGYVPPDGSFTPIVPARLVETRADLATADNQYNAIGMRAAGSVTDVQITGRVGVPANASAVVLNVTVTEPTGPGFITVYPCGGQRPTSSNLDYVPGDTVPNAVVVKVGDGGKVCFYTLAPTQLIVDINGYFGA
ncbi:MAG: fibronectin type III domain-containing protein [Ilumatobacteraceae bacterium]